MYAVQIAHYTYAVNSLNIVFFVQGTAEKQLADAVSLVK